MWTFIRYELRYWLRTPMIWIFLFINTLLVFFAMASDNVQIGGSIGNIHKNAPYVIENFYSVMSVVCLLMTTAFMNATANRDFQYGMHQFVFSSPIKKSDYFFGKFFGAVIISVIPMLGVSLGALLAPVLSPLFGMAPAERFGEIIWSAHLYGILNFGLPNVIISGVLLYSLGIIFRSSMVSFIGGMLLLIIYSFSGRYMRDIQNEFAASLIDPFGGTAFEIMTKYMTVAEKNAQSVAFMGDLMLNRLLWIGITLVILFVVYWRFSFNSRNEKAKKPKKIKHTPAPVASNAVFEPTKANAFSLSIFWNIIKFETRAIVKSPSFLTLMIIGLILLIADLTMLTSMFGTTRYPVTYIVVASIEDNYELFMIGFITFYTGILVWKERDAKINEIEDATPVWSGMLFAAKVIAIMTAIAIVLIGSIVIGVMAQTLYGYTRYELDVYIKSLLGLRLLAFLFLTILSLLFHYLINNRYIAYFAFVTFIIVNSFIWGLLEFDSNMISFGHRPTVTYSDMNGFGPFVPGMAWFSLYWTLFCLILCFVISLFYIRGKEPQFRYRWAEAKIRFGQKRMAIIASIVIFALCGSFVYYNTKVLNHYDSSEAQESKQVDYEKKYKKYEHLVQPRYCKIDYQIDIMPEDRSLVAKAQFWLKNVSVQPIQEVHFSMPSLSEEVKLSIAGQLKHNDKDLYYRIYKLNHPLLPNDSIKVDYELQKINKGFENEVSFTQLTQNGTFFNNTDIMPSIGYNSEIEISDKNERVKRKLPPRERMPKLNDNDLKARSNTYLNSDSDWVTVNTTISTSPDQIAIAPGSLVKTWTSNGRKYFNYKLDQKSLNFYSFISGRYEVARKKWNGIDLEVYYDKAHAYNVPNMLSSMQKSLDYYTTNFGPYRHKQCRIIEFPRYASFAQAFPGTMPYSESIGFITDLRDVKAQDIDMVYYVVAHEMGHQYWAHQICGANMQGSEMMSEGFAQYSALMVMEKEYGKDKMKKFLKYEMDDYLNGRSRELEGENPLMKTESQQYIHYNKASVVMYYLKEMIGEQKVNGALKNLITEFGYKNPPYPTANMAVREFRKATPDSLQYLVSDLFEKITLFNNRMLEAKYKKVGNAYQVTLKTVSEKFYSDKLGDETAVPVADYIDIGVFAKPTEEGILGKVLLKKRLKITQKDNTFTFTVNGLPYEAGIDPYNYLVDRIPDDNIRKLEE
ncbi:M1 family aminopeptidase [Flavobacterium sp.]|uniref:ABC transporter permease/M1 family aminopeptidase n=1 Tax=Flavobacterium sp. TaxID=239 RepID=UPI0039E6FB6D